MSPGEQRKETLALNNRLAAFLSFPMVKNIVGQRRSTLDIQRAIQDKEILLIRLPMKTRKEHAALIGTILLAHIHAATFSFGKMSWNERPGYSLYVDEFQNFSTADFSVLVKEGRKYGIRITVAHQDRHDLIPENRSATLTASIIVIFQPTVADAAEIAPLVLDSTEKLHPEHIYSETLRYLRLHENREVQDFFRQFVLSSEKQHNKQAQDVLEVLKDLLYQSVKTRTIHESLFEAYTQKMFSVLDLTFESPSRKHEQIYAKQRQQQQTIEKLTSYLASDQTFEDYLAEYYNYSFGYRLYRRIECYYWPSVPEEYLYTDNEFWDRVLDKTPRPAYEKLPSEKLKRRKNAMESLKKEAAENDELRHHNSKDKILAEEKANILAKRKPIADRFMSALADVHKHISESAIYSSIRRFHAYAYQICISTPLDAGGEVFFWQPIGSRSKRGVIDHSTRVDELVAEPLAIETHISQERLLSWLPNQGPESKLRRERVLEAWKQVTGWYAELQRIDDLLADETAILRMYYSDVGRWTRNRGLWEELNNEQVDQNVWKALDREAGRNAILSSQMNTVEKIINLRKNELRKKILLLAEEAEAYEATIPTLRRRIGEEIASIERRRAAFCAYVHRILQIVMDEPGPLGERRAPKEIDTRQKLLDLQKRQAIVRVSGDTEQKPQIYTIKTSDVPQAVKKEELERRLHFIREQTREKYCRPRREVEQEFERSYTEISGDEKENHEDESPDSWYEEEE